MSYFVAIANAKGGVAKTTTAVSLGAALNEEGKSILLVDLDPHANLTLYLGIKPTALQHTLADVLMGGQSIKVIKHPTQINDLDIIPANHDLSLAESHLVVRENYETMLGQHLMEENSYDYIFMDCPPTLGILTYNAIMAADLLLIPVQPGVGAVNGLDALLEVAQELRDEHAVPYRILITMFDLRTSRTNAIFEEFLEEHRRRLLKTIVFKSESLNQANLAGKPVTRFAPSSRGAFDYEQLSDEILRLRV